VSDPAVEAAKGAFANMPIMVEAAGTQPVLKALVLEVGAAAAREALRPIRELHYSVGAGTPTGEFAEKCCTCPEYWPCETARLVYAAEELP